MQQLDSPIILQILVISFYSILVNTADIPELTLNGTNLKAAPSPKQNLIGVRQNLTPLQFNIMARSSPIYRNMRADLISVPRSQIDPLAIEVTQKQAELEQMMQQLNQAESDVQLQAGEVTRIQLSVAEAIQQLEEASSKARQLSMDLQAAQQEASFAAMRAHTAQLQLAAHDHLMYAARQRVDSISAQMLSVQSELASVQQIFIQNTTLHLREPGPSQEDQGKPSVSFNPPSYGQVFTNETQPVVDPLGFKPEPVGIMALEQVNLNHKRPISELSTSPINGNSIGGPFLWQVSPQKRRP